MIEIQGYNNTAKVFTDIMDDVSKEQIKTLCDQEFVKDSQIRIMPDVHAGAGCTIGTTMTIKDKIVPNLVGVDIVASLKCVRKLFSSLIDLIGCLAVCVLIGIILFPGDEPGSCADDGGVWDDELKVCRFDCHHWNKKDGCILITDKELEDFVNGYCNGEGNGLHRCSQARLELSKRRLRDKTNQNNLEHTE